MRVNSTDVAKSNVAGSSNPDTEALNQTTHSPTQERRHLIVLALVTVLLAAIYPLLAESPYRGSADFHATIEMVGALLGLVAGFALIVRFYTLGNRSHLFIGLAFFVNGAEDLIHGLLSFDPVLQVVGLPASSLEQFIPGTYVTGRLLMGVILLLAASATRWLGESRDPRRETKWVSLAVLIITVLATAVAFQLPLPTFIYPDRFISRPVDFTSAIVLLVAIVAFLREYRRRRDVLTWWILLSIAVNTVGQVQMSFSKSLFDPFFDIAHVYKVLGYVIPLLGFSLCQIAIITERVRAEKALHEYAERLHILREMDQAILEAQSPEAIAQAALQRIRQLVPCARASVAEFDFEAGEATVLAAHTNGETEAGAGARLPLDAFGVTEELWQGQVHVVEDVLTISQPPPAVQARPVEGVRAYVNVPLVAQGELIGALNLCSEGPGAFTEEQIEIAREVADQLAVAFQQARLHEQVQRHAKELEQRVAERTAELRAANEEIQQRADELAALYEVGRDLAVTLDLEVLLPAIAQRVTDTLEADRCIVFLFDERAGVLRARAAHGYVAERLADFSCRPGEEAVGQAYATGKPQYVPDLDLVPDLPRRDAIRAVLAVPLESQTASPLGVLSVTSLQPEAFTPNQQRLLETMAGQIAGAIENARLLQRQQVAVSRLRTLNGLMVGIVGARALDRTLDAIAQAVVDLLGCDMAAVALHDPVADEIRIPVEYGYRGFNRAFVEQFSLPAGSGAGGKAFAEGRVGVIPDTRAKEGVIDHVQAERAGIRAMLVGPLQTPEHRLGVLYACQHRPYSFSEDEVALFSILAGQAAVAVENARLYEELAVARDRAQESDRLKSAFLATMSHELRTPLNSVIGFTGIMLQGLAGPLNDEQTKQLGMVRDSARHLLNLINDVLDISKIEAGQVEIVSEPFDMREAIEKVVRTVSPLAGKKSLQLTAEISPEVGQITSDRRRVEQVLINLVNNAVKFTEKGEVRVECEVSDGWLVARVVDTGIGIKPEDVGVLFEPFRQIETGLARRHEGTGLGLSICKKLVEMLGGEIWAESEYGVGSKFTFTLPSDLSLRGTK